MISDHINNLPTYEKIGIDTPAILQFITRAQREQLPPGRYDLDGEQMFAMVQEYDTKSPQDCLYESHKKYMDIQYMAQGSEMMYVAGIENLSVTEDRTPKEDAILYAPAPHEAALLVKEQHFALFLPQDGHMPCCQCEQSRKVRKLVFKIRIRQ